MKQMYDNTTGHIIADVDGKLMLIDTGAARTFYDEYQGVRINELARMVGQPLDGVLGMDSIRGQILSLTRNTVHFNAAVPAHEGAPLEYCNGVPCIMIKINQIPCRAIIKTGATISYISETLMSRDKYTRTVSDSHPFYGTFRVRMYANYFSIGNRNFFADAGELPHEFELLSSIGAEAVIGADLLERFDLVMDFAADRLHLVTK